jgi:hypothetical protein
MLLKKIVHLVAIMTLGFAPLKMLDPVDTGVLHLWREVLIYAMAFDLAYKCAWPICITCAHECNRPAHPTPVLLKTC